MDAISNKTTELLIDLARNVAGFGDDLLVSSDLKVIRATLREFRDQARAASDAYDHDTRESADDVARLTNSIKKIEEHLCEEPPRIGDALFICEAAQAR